MDLICSRCGSAVRDRGDAYSCRCLTVNKVVARKLLPGDAVGDLFLRGRTGVIRGFVSRKGDPFDASLSVEGSRLAFQFDRGQAKAARSTAISISRGSSGLVHLGVDGCCALDRWVHFGLVSPQLSECYAAIAGVRYAAHTLGDTSKERVALKVSCRLFVKYLLCHQSPRSPEVRGVVSYLRDALSAFNNWSAELVPARRQSLGGTFHENSFPSGIFPWLHAIVKRQGDRIVVELPPDPAVQAQFRASIMLAAPQGDGAFAVPVSAGKAVCTWLRVVRGEPGNHRAEEGCDGTDHLRAF